MKTTRKDFLRCALAAGAFPAIVPSSVLGAEAPSNKLQIGIIGLGRIGTTMDGLVANQDLAMLTTICDVDSVRLANMKQLAEKRYGRKMDHLKLEMDYRKVLDDPGIDGVMICTQDHWHARMVVEACYKGRVFHIGTQQRGQYSFRQGVECVMSGRLGTLKRIDVELPLNNPDREWNVPSIERTPDPKDFDFDLWLGPARDGVPYSQLRTHWRPVDGNGKPYARIPGQNVGWLQIQDYCTGNIGGWGSHHMDIAQWAMGNAGPISVCCDKANFLTGRMFNVHHEYHILYKYANGVDLHCASRKYSGLPKGLRSNGGWGVRFMGANGDWIWTSRGSAAVAAADRVDTAYKAKADFWRALEANKKELIDGDPEKHAVRNPLKGHHRVWFVGMRGERLHHLLHPRLPRDEQHRPHDRLGSREARLHESRRPEEAVLLLRASAVRGRADHQGNPQESGRLNARINQCQFVKPFARRLWRRRVSLPSYPTHRVPRRSACAAAIRSSTWKTESTTCTSRPVTRWASRSTPPPTSRIGCQTRGATSSAAPT